MTESIEQGAIFLAIVKQSLMREIEAWENEGRDEATCEGAVVGNKDQSLMIDPEYDGSAWHLINSFNKHECLADQMLEDIYSAHFAYGYNQVCEERAEFLRTTRIP